jgi:hypothetical protein
LFSTEDFSIPCLENGWDDGVFFRDTESPGGFYLPFQVDRLPFQMVLW